MKHVRFLFEKMDLDKFNYECQGQISMFDITMPMISIMNKIRLIELFAGYGSQAMALDEMGVNYEHYKVVEFDKYAVQSYNAVHGTCFEPSDIRDIHGNDLEILYTDLFTYLLTYSFPCTDLSVAGKMQGMSKGSGTRSGLLWEVERILTEIHDSGGELPQILFMENVPQVLSSANIKDFHAWQDFLAGLGYTNHVQVLNAKDYGVAQNRERAFMFSFLGEYNYKFPEPIPLTKTMKDYLEDEVEEKYYINTQKAAELINSLVGNKYLNPRADYTPSIYKTSYPLKSQDFTRTGFSDISYTLSARDYKDPKIVVVGNNNQPKTIVRMVGRNPDNPSDRTAGVPTEQRLEPNSQGICNTITSVQKDNMVLERNILGGFNYKTSPDFQRGILPNMSRSILADNDGAACIEETVRIKQATKDGYIDCKIGGVADLSFPTSKTRRGRVQDNGDTCPTLTAGESEIYRIESLYRIRKLTIRECGRLMAVSDDNITRMMISSSDRAKEFFRMCEEKGIRYKGKREFTEAERIQKMSNSQLYKEFGNSIVVLCMIAMFSNLNIQGLPRWDEIKHRYAA